MERLSLSTTFPVTQEKLGHGRDENPKWLLMTLAFCTIKTQESFISCVYLVIITFKYKFIVNYSVLSLHPCDSCVHFNWHRQSSHFILLYLACCKFIENLVFSHWQDIIKWDFFKAGVMSVMPSVLQMMECFVLDVTHHYLVYFYFPLVFTSVRIIAQAVLEQNLVVPSVYCCSVGHSWRKWACFSFSHFLDGVRFSSTVINGRFAIWSPGNVTI